MKRKTVLWTVIVLLMALLLSGCAEMAMETVAKAAEKTGIVEPTAQMIDGLMRDDFDTCLALLPDTVTESQFREVYDQLRQTLAQAESYTLTPLNVNMHSANGVTTYQVRFLMESGELTFYVDAATSSEAEGFASFYITPYVPAAATGSILTLKGTNVLQWVFLLVAALETAFVVWMVIDCSRRKMQYKPVWLIAILLGNLILSLTWNDGTISFNFNIGVILSYTALLRYSTGGFLARLLLPVGAICYFALRKTLKPKAARQQMPQPQYPQNPGGPQPWYPQQPQQPYYGQPAPVENAPGTQAAQQENGEAGTNSADQ